MPLTTDPKSPLYGLDFNAAYVDHCFGLNSDVFEVLKDNSSGGVAVADAVGGVLTLSSGATSAADNDGIYYATKAEVVKFDRDFVIKSKFKYSEAGANVANAVAIGCVSNAAVATILTANGAGPTASLLQAMIYKLDGETVWRCACSDGTTIQTHKTKITAASTEFVDFEIQFKLNPDGVYGTVVYLIDGVVCIKADSNWQEPITHEIAIVGATEMNVLCGGQTGSAAEETFSLDAIGFQTIP